MPLSAGRWQELVGQEQLCPCPVRGGWGHCCPRGLAEDTEGPKVQCGPEPEMEGLGILLQQQALLWAFQGTPKSSLTL